MQTAKTKLDITTHTLPADGKPGTRFSGQIIGYAQSRPDNGSPGFSGSTGCWVELSLYKTTGGNYVCHRANLTNWQGQQDSYETISADNTNRVIEFFGQCWIAKDLYDDAGIDNAIDID